jgi:hypothetical protein
LRSRLLNIGAGTASVRSSVASGRGGLRTGGLVRLEPPLPLEELRPISWRRRLERLALERLQARVRFLGIRGTIKESPTWRARPRVPALGCLAAPVESRRATECPPGRARRRRRAAETGPSRAEPASARARVGGTTRSALAPGARSKPEGESRVAKAGRRDHRAAPT